MLDDRKNIECTQSKHTVRVGPTISRVNQRTRDDPDVHDVRLWGRFGLLPVPDRGGLCQAGARPDARRDHRRLGAQGMPVQGGAAAEFEASRRRRGDEGVEDPGLLHVVRLESPRRVLPPGRIDTYVVRMREGGRVAGQPLVAPFRIDTLRDSHPLCVLDLFRRHSRIMAPGLQGPRRVGYHGVQGMDRRYAAQRQLCHGADRNHAVRGLPVMTRFSRYSSVCSTCHSSGSWRTDERRDTAPCMYPYLFMDTTLGRRATYFMVMLMAAMVVFVALFALLDACVSVIEQRDYGIIPNLWCVVSVSFVLMKFKD